MRCVGAEDPPCKRCRNANLECVMEKPGRGALEGVGEESVSTYVMSTLNAHVSRIRSLESQMSVIQHTLGDLVSTIRQGMSSGALPQQSAPLAPPSSSWLQGATSSFDLPFIPSGQNFGFPPKQEVVVNPPFDGSDPGSTSTYPSQPSPYFPPTDLARITGSMPSLPFEMARQPKTPTVAAPYGSRHRSLPPSRAGSPTLDRDLLGLEEITNPLGNMSNMAGLVEAAVERAREEQQHIQTSALKQPNIVADGSRPVKRARFSPEEPSGHSITEMQDLPVRSATKRKRAKRTHIHAYPDAVAEGLVTEEEGRELMDLYVEGPRR